MIVYCSIGDTSLRDFYIMTWNTGQAGAADFLTFLGLGFGPDDNIKGQLIPKGLFFCTKNEQKYLLRIIVVYLNKKKESPRRVHVPVH